MAHCGARTTVNSGSAISGEPPKACTCWWNANQSTAELTPVIDRLADLLSSPCLPSFHTYRKTSASYADWSIQSRTERGITNLWKHGDVESLISGTKIIGIDWKISGASTWCLFLGYHRESHLAAGDFKKFPDCTSEWIVPSLPNRFHYQDQRWSIGMLTGSSLQSWSSWYQFNQVYIRWFAQLAVFKAAPIFACGFLQVTWWFSEKLNRQQGHHTTSNGDRTDGPRSWCFIKIIVKVSKLYEVIW